MTTTHEIQNDERYKLVLDNGFCGLVDHMGDDAAIVAAARVSYAKGTRSVRDNRGLLRYLMRHNHTSPFEMCVAKFHMRMPIFVARQFVRHRTASINETSARYSILETEFYLPEPTVMAQQSALNNQGRSETPLSPEMAEALRSLIATHSDSAARLYGYLLDGSPDEDNGGLARELARIVLPVSTYTEWYWCANLHNILRLLALRRDKHAQYEIRVFADAMAEQLAPLFPMTMEAFDDYVFHASHFSRMEMDLIRDLLRRSGTSVIDVLAQLGDEQALIDQYDLTKREYREFCAKFVDN